LPRLAETIVARALDTSRPGVTELRFALDPEDLGPVRIRIEASGDRVLVRIVATSGAAAQHLGGGIPRLVAQLQHAGFGDAHVDLSFDDGGAGAGPHDRDGNGEPGRSGSSPRSPWAVVEPLASPTHPVARSGGLDLVA